MIKRIKNIWLFKIIIFKWKYPKSSIHPSSDVIDKGGTLSCAGHNQIGEFCKIILHKDASLTIGLNSWLGRNVYIEPVENKKIAIGKDSSIQDNCRLIGEIQIGNGVLFAPNVFMSSGEHFFYFQPWLPIRMQDKIIKNSKDFDSLKNKKIIIEDDCWIGVNAVIKRGVTICKGAIIGANSVVTKNVEPYKIVVGAPAKAIKERLSFNPPDILSASDVSNIPYFYHGFICEIIENGKVLVSAQKNSCAVLKQKQGEKLIIAGKSLMPESKKITANIFLNKLFLGNYEIPLANNFTLEISLTNITISEKQNNLFFENVIADLRYYNWIFINVVHEDENDENRYFNVYEMEII